MLSAPQPPHRPRSSRPARPTLPSLLAVRRVSLPPPEESTGQTILKRVATGEPLREIALSYNVDHSTIFRLKARYAAEV